MSGEQMSGSGEGRSRLSMSLNRHCSTRHVVTNIHRPTSNCAAKAMRPVATITVAAHRNFYYEHSSSETDVTATVTLVVRSTGV